MSNNEGPTSPGDALQKRRERRPRKADDRIRRTRRRLGDALVALMLEKPVDSITVQEVLDQAAVGRSTFYLHYRDKDDLFLCVLEEGLEMWSTVLGREREKSLRVVPVEEFFAHVASARKLYRALADAGRLNDFFDLAQGYFARGAPEAIAALDTASAKRIGRSHVRIGWESVVPVAMVDGPRRKRNAARYGRTFSPDGVEGTRLAVLMGRRLIRTSFGAFLENVEDKVSGVTRKCHPLVGGP